ncbi:MAG: sulfatase-like hydrolase/transferase [Planctomycetota bacterium]
MKPFLIVLVFFAGLRPVSSSETSRPNIVYIIADDQSWTDYGFMGNERVHTPNLDKLAERSARFTNGYVPSSVCRPSLVSLLTGLYPHQHGVHFNHGPPGNAGYNRMTSVEQYEGIREREFQLIREHKTLPGLLAQAGYRCFQTGKFWEGHWRNGGFTEGMTTFDAPPPSQTFGGARRLANGEVVAHGNGDAGLQIGRVTMQPIFDFIDKCAETETPWFVWYAPYLPHQPHDSPDQFYDLARSLRNVRNHELPYFASIAQFDETVGQLITYVSDQGHLKNTVFVFVSDNGWRPDLVPQQGRPEEFAHTARSKRAPFDDGLRTPILVRWEGAIQPSTWDSPISSIDLMPTLLAIAGVEKSHWPMLPGINILPVCRGRMELDSDRPIFGGIYPGDATSLDNPSADIAYRWIRRANLKLIVPHEQADGSQPWGGHLQTPSLFDLKVDPFEKHDLSNQPEYRHHLKRLRSDLDQWWNPQD